jgi:hypothetical protein
MGALCVWNCRGCGRTWKVEGEREEDGGYVFRGHMVHGERCPAMVDQDGVFDEDWVTSAIDFAYEPKAVH